MIFSNFAVLDRWDLQPTDKGKLTAFPAFLNLSALLNVSDMQLPEINSERWLDLADLEGEVWRDVVEYEGLYSVSNYGRVKSLGRNMPHPTRTGRMHKRRQRIMKLQSHHGGYQFVCLCKSADNKGWKSQVKAVHRLVALSFLDNPNGLPQINHKDENPRNNTLENLEWCDAKYNNNYGTHAKRLSATLREKNYDGVMVHQYSLSGEYIATYKSAKEAARVTGVDDSRILSAAKGVTKKGGNYQWSYEQRLFIEPYKFALWKKVYQYDKDGNFIREYDSAVFAARELGKRYADRQISNCCTGLLKHAYGYKWSYERV